MMDLSRGQICSYEQKKQSPEWVRGRGRGPREVAHVPTAAWPFESACAASFVSISVLMQLLIHLTLLVRCYNTCYTISSKDFISLLQSGPPVKACRGESLSLIPSPSLSHNPTTTSDRTVGRGIKQNCHNCRPHMSSQMVRTYSRNDWFIYVCGLLSFSTGDSFTLQEQPGSGSSTAGSGCSMPGSGCSTPHSPSPTPCTVAPQTPSTASCTVAKMSECLEM